MAGTCVLMSITIILGFRLRFLEAQGEVSKDIKSSTDGLRGLETTLRRRDVVEFYSSIRHLAFHQLTCIGGPGMKRDIAEYVRQVSLRALKIKAGTLRKNPSGLLQQPEIPSEMGEGYTMD
ncbi:hypothetical protein Tco_0628345 [Tanacetum coccineum]|uniref:Uncharacterized protein n=1 Tax=Tanacetum coccineum TaxID=301880 RepID=A0ABQ4WQ59_9ASTR